MTSRHGLANVGNTCYLNSAFQALRMTTPFQRYFGTDAWASHRHEDRKGYALASHVAELVTTLGAPGDTMIIPSKFVRAFIEFAQSINDDIRLGMQADAAEAVQILLDGLHSQQSREVLMNIKGSAVTDGQKELVKSLESWSSFFRKEYSPLIDAFYGQTQTKVICQGCKACSTRYEPWGVLKLPIPGGDKAGNPAPSFNDCFKAAFAYETLDDYVCDACKVKGPARMEHAVSRFPKNLIVSFKRFTNTGAKIRGRLPYDENNIDLSIWRAWERLQPTPIYRVMSTVEHMGGSHCGHYIMRNREGDGWFLYDDATVRPCAEGGSSTPDTYMLFLEQIV